MSSVAVVPSIFRAQITTKCYLLIYCKYEKYRNKNWWCLKSLDKAKSLGHSFLNKCNKYISPSGHSNDKINWKWSNHVVGVIIFHHITLQLQTTTLHVFFLFCFQNILITYKMQPVSWFNNYNGQQVRKNVYFGLNMGSCSFFILKIYALPYMVSD